MLEEKIYNDYLTALRSKNRHKIDFLSFIRSELKNEAINLKKDKLDDNEALVVLKKQQKKLKDSQESVKGLQRNDFTESIERELTLINSYLPEPLSDSELAQIVEETILQTQAQSMKDLGKVMKEVMARAGVRADSKKISVFVKDRLSSLQ